MDTKWNGTNHNPGEDVEYYVASQIQDALEGAEAAPGVIQVTPKKHPRFRAWTGVLALLAGFALVAGSLLSGLAQWINGSNQEWWKLDWQETGSFQSAVSGYVRDFLTLGAGGELEWYDTVLADTWETDHPWSWDTSASTAVELDDPAEPEPDAAYQGDKNVLYRILDNGKLLYANTDEAIAYTQGLPEGYSFLLVFKDGKAQAWKDGEELDLYGNGIYTRESPWYLPGYENFTAGEDVAGVEVRMAVREEPIPYLQGQYAGGYVEGDSPMYALYDSLREARQSYLACAVTCIAGLFVLSLAFFWKEDRRRAEAAIAAKTRYVWTELRFLAVVVCLLGVLWSVSFWNVFYMVQSALYRLGAGQWPDLISRGLSLVISLVLSNPVAVLALCLVLWLIHNDHRYNPKPRRSLLRSLLRSLRAKDLQRPVERRLTRRAAAPAAVLAAAGIGGVMVLLVGNKLWWWNIYGGYIAVTVVLYFLVLAFCCLCAWQQRPLARDLGVRQLVIHGGFVPQVYFPEWYVEQSVLFWRELLAELPPDMTIALENVMEPEPRLLADIARQVDNPRLGLCLDVGHANTFVSRVPPLEWVAPMAPWLRHVHLHNNAGHNDLHDPLGQGTLAMEQVLDTVLALCPAATFTLENQDCGPSLDWLRQHGYGANT